MPEISQDQFETMYPANPPATPQQLRLRANSAGARSGIQNINNNNTFDVITESAVFDRSNSMTSNTDEEIAIARSSARQLRLLSETSVGDGEMATSFVEFHNDNFYGYKRELSHRLVKYPYIFIKIKISFLGEILNRKRVPEFFHNTIY